MALSNLAARVIVAIIAIPIVAGAAYVGGWVLALLLAIVSALAARELYGIAAHGGYTPLTRLGVLLAFLLPFAVHFFRTGRFVPPELRSARWSSSRFSRSLSGAGRLTSTRSARPP